MVDEDCFLQVYRDPKDCGKRTKVACMCDVFMQDVCNCEGKCGDCIGTVEQNIRYD